MGENMGERIYKWTRFWAPRESTMHLDLRGYLQNPETGDGKLFNSHLRPLADLTSSSCVVLLGEPGTGKTRALADEREAEEKRIAATGGNALWIDLRDIGSSAELRAALVEDPNWSSPLPLHLFLDSMDESPIGVDAIVAPLLKALATRKTEPLMVRLVCRTAEWPAALEQALQKRWPGTTVYEIAPLRRVDVEQAATVHGLDPARTLTVIAEREIEAFALRPVTLRFVLTRLEAGKPLPRSKVELYMQLCRSLCEEPSETRSRASVSPDERLALAERVAASLLFGGKTSVVVDPNRGDLLEGDLHVSELVGDREPVEGELFANATEPTIRAAMSTGLFNARGRGQLGFAHHTFAEFLAARYVRKHQLPIAQVRSLLVHPGLNRVVPMLHGVAAWLASMDRDFFEFVLARDPHVLLGADAAMFDDERKRELVQLVLARYDKRQQLDRDFFRRSPFAKLAHDGLDGLLKPYVLGKLHDPGARRVAIGIAEACKTTSLCDALLGVVDDRSDHLGVRSAAAHAITVLGSEQHRMLLKPWVTTADLTDKDEDIKGYALRALWPENLSISEVIAALTPSRARFYGGPYQIFFQHDLFVRTTDTDLIALLAWSASQESRQVLDEPAHGLLDALLEKCWEKLDDPAIALAFAQAVAARMLRYDLPVFKRTYHDDLWSRDHDKRRLVLASLLRVAENTDTGRYGFRKLFGIGDIAWLVGMLETALEPSARTLLLGLLVDALTFESSFELVDSLAQARARHPDLAAALRPIFEEVPVDGPVATEARASQARLKALFAQPQPRAKLPSTAVRVLGLLDRFDAGDTAAYWEIDAQLGLDDRGYQQLTLLKSDLTTLPGWGQIDEDLRRRIVRSASKYLVDGRCSPDSWVGKGHQWNPALAGYRALRVLMKEDRAAFDALGSSIWKEWAPIVGSFPGLDPARAKEHGLLVHAYRHAPDTTLKPILIECMEDDEKLGHVFAHRRLEVVWDDRIGVALLELAQRALNPDSLGELLGTLLAHGTPGSLEFGESLVRLPVPVDSGERSRMLAACTNLMRYSLAETWSSLREVLIADRAFGREIVSAVAQDVEARSKPFTSSLSERECAELLLWLETEFPQFQDPEGKEAPAVGIREGVAHMRNRILRDLATRGTMAALEVLREAEESKPGTSYLRWAVLEAEHHAVARMWKPVAPAELRALARDTAKRLVSDDDSLLEVVVASLERLRTKLQDESRRVRFLWDKQRGDGSFVPVDENVLSDFVRDHLQTDIVSSGIVLNREVQLRPSVGIETGERTDIHVDAVSLDPLRRGYDLLTLVIETKGSWNKELFTAMTSQLHGRYLSGTRVRRGIYLVGWFASALWTPDDSRRAGRRCALDAVVLRLRQEAASLSTAGIRIEAVVLDATLPGEPARAGRTAGAASLSNSRRTKSLSGHQIEVEPKTGDAKKAAATSRAKKMESAKRQTSSTKRSARSKTRR